MPFVVASASGVAAVTKLETKAVVAICVELLVNAAVGAVGVPVNEGEAIVALNNISAVFDAINVGRVVMVDEATPPTVLIVVGNVPIPLPLASPVKVIN